MASRKPKARDWHPADIKAALAKRGYTFARIARENGYTNPTTPNNVLRRPFRPIEEIVAGLLGKHPKDIWPSRYDENGRSKHIRGGARARKAA